MKNLITTGFVAYTLYCFWRIFYQIGTQHSTDGAAGFLIGLVFMALFILQAEGIYHLCDVIKIRLAGRKMYEYK